MKNYRITVQYDGTRYNGWQKQGNTSNTIEEKFENVLSIMCQKKVEIFASGRTDAGVHADCQVANFKCETNLEPLEIKSYLNHFLPDDISSCVSIRTRFGCVFLRHCIVKILANASALAPFLPRIVAKTQHRKFFEPKQDKIDCFSRRQVAGILTYFKTDNVEKRLFYLILASSDTDATA